MYKHDKRNYKLHLFLLLDKINGCIANFLNEQ